MKHIVITGSTRGIGFGLAKSLLELGCSITLSGRSPSSVEEAVRKLSPQYGDQQILGCACDVRKVEEVKALWQASKARFGKVDVWINNAGYSGPQMKPWKIPPAEAQAVIETNLLGVIYGSQVAIEGMLAQGFGGLYNMEGMGSDGRKHDGLALYGTTKYGLRYFNDCLVREAQGTGLVIASLSPGMVVTDMIRRQYEERPLDWERAKRVFNLLADRVETVTPWLARQILTNQKSGRRIAWLSKRKLLGRILSSPFSKRNLFD